MDETRFTLPPDLPVPEDDGAAAHLPGRTLPGVALPVDDGSTVDLSTLPGRVVVFAYPRTGRPDEPISDEWNAIPGARGCTNEVCSVRDQMLVFRSRDVAVFGLSAQTTSEQEEAARRLRLTYPLLSDAGRAFGDALGLPTFEWEGTRLLKRITLLVRDGVIEDVIYPVFPPDEAAAAALAALD